MTQARRWGWLTFVLLSGGLQAQQSVPDSSGLTLLGPADRHHASLARAINNSGTIAGLATVNPGPPGAHAVLWVPQGQGYTPQDLGTLPGGKFSEARALNDNGQVVGHSDVSDVQSGGIPGGGCIHAFLWTNGQMQNLGTLGGHRSSAAGINLLGQVVGVSTVPSAPNQPLQPDPAGHLNLHATLWTRGQLGYEIRDLGTLPGGTQSAAHAINSAGQIVGASEGNAPQADRPGGGGGIHAVLWLNGQIQDLGTLGGESSSASALNDALQVVGGSQILPSGRTIHAFLWDQNGMHDLGTLGGEDSFATGINTQGQVVGLSQTSSGAFHAFRWTQGVMVDLGAVPDSWSAALGINDHGQIAGTVLTPNSDRLRRLLALDREGTEQDFFRSCSGLKSETEVVEVEEGGFNGSRIKRHGAAIHFPGLTLHASAWKVPPP